MTFTNAASAELQDVFFGKASFVAKSLHLALSTTAPARDGTNITEPPGANGYARLPVLETDFGNSTIADPAVLTNTSEFDFGESTGAFGDITHAVLFDALVNGTAQRIFTLAQSLTIGTGQIVRVKPGTLLARL